mmetsp:Transcript_130380/g.260084  ORF Transcript_130380/g.260084 Transcript_130380/m.260084 type:complete len:217 (+) Transcript_130380:1964-2614(+)
MSISAKRSRRRPRVATDSWLLSWLLSASASPKLSWKSAPLKMGVAANIACSNAFQKHEFPELVRPAGKNGPSGPIKRRTLKASSAAPALSRRARCRAASSERPPRVSWRAASASASAALAAKARCKSSSSPLGKPPGAPLPVGSPGSGSGATGVAPPNHQPPGSTVPGSTPGVPAAWPGPLWCPRLWSMVLRTNSSSAGLWRAILTLQQEKATLNS